MEVDLDLGMGWGSGPDPLDVAASVQRGPPHPLPFLHLLDVGGLLPLPQLPEPFEAWALQAFQRSQRNPILHACKNNDLNEITLSKSSNLQNTKSQLLGIFLSTPPHLGAKLQKTGHFPAEKK